MARVNGQVRTKKMRLVGWSIQPIIMADDGENLTPINVGATMIPATEWDDFKSGGDERALEELRQQVEGAAS